MLNAEERRQIVKVVNLYYKEGLTQMEISKRMGVSRPIISKMVQKAKDVGIVEIYIKDESTLTVELEIELERKFGLKDVIVVAEDEYSESIMKRKIGLATASFVQKKLTGNVNKLGISWGETVAEFVREYPYERGHKIEVIPLVGGMGAEQVHLHSNQLAYELAKKMDAKCTYLYAPAFVEKAELCKRLTSMEDISYVLEKGRNVDIAVVGIGNPLQNSTMEKIGYLKPEDLLELKQQEAIGDISSRFYNIDGKEIAVSLNERVIGISLEDLKNIPLVIGICEGKHKFESVLATLNGRYIDVLVVDERNAVKLLKRK
ncbi:MAG: sugar-binding transcriptional regulator [Solibacillus sp.]